MKKAPILLMPLIVAACLAGCDSGPTSPRGFRLPDGDALAGRESFLALECHECHTMSGEDFDEIPDRDLPYVELGGSVTRVKTYAELVTSIINPSHRLAGGYAKKTVSVDGESKMYNYNAVMTVQELVDIVTFLQPHYEVDVPEEFQYPIYP